MRLRREARAAARQESSRASSSACSSSTSATRTTREDVESMGRKRARATSDANEPPGTIAAAATLTGDGGASSADTRPQVALDAPCMSSTADVRTFGGYPSFDAQRVPRFVFDEILRLVGHENWLSLAGVCRAWLTFVRSRFKELPEFERSDLVALQLKRWMSWFGDQCNVAADNTDRFHTHPLCREIHVNERAELEEDERGNLQIVESDRFSHLDADTGFRREQSAIWAGLLILRCVELRHFHCMCYLLSLFTPYERERVPHFLIVRTELLCWPAWARTRGPDSRVQSALPIAGIMFDDFAMTDVQALRLVHDALAAGDMALVNWVESRQPPSFRDVRASPLFAYRSDEQHRFFLDVIRNRRGQWREAVRWLCERSDAIISNQVSLSPAMFRLAAQTSGRFGVEFIEWIRAHDPTYAPSTMVVDEAMLFASVANATDTLRYLYAWLPEARGRGVPAGACQYAFKNLSWDSLRWLRANFGCNWSNVERAERLVVLKECLDDMSSRFVVEPMLFLFDEFGLPRDDPHLRRALRSTPITAAVVRQMLTTKLGVQFDDEDKAII